MGERIDSQELKAFASQLGFQTVGICLPTRPAHFKAYESWIGKGYQGQMEYLARHAALKSDPAHLLEGAQSIVVCSLNYFQEPTAGNGQARIARYALGRDYHKVLRKKLDQLGDWICAQYPNAKWRACVDSAPIMERDFAEQSGLGFFGKNTMIIDPRRGSWFFLGLLLTTVPFQTDQPFEGSCGTCTKCIDACPTGAIVYEEERWQLDARRCISYLTIEHSGEIDPTLESKMGDWTFGCDVCQEVCPFNEQRETQPLRSETTMELDFSNHKSWPSLSELTDISQERWDQLTRGSAVRRTGIDGMRRNAAINLRNRSTSKTGSE